MQPLEICEEAPLLVEDTNFPVHGIDVSLECSTTSAEFVNNLG